MYIFGLKKNFWYKAAVASWRKSDLFFHGCEIEKFLK